MRIILSIGLGLMLLVGQATAAESQKAPKEMKSQKEKTSATEQQKTKVDDLKSQKEKLSYSLGYDVGKVMKSRNADIDPDLFFKAFKEALAGKKAAMTDQEMREAVQPLQAEMKAKREEAMKEAAEKNRQLGEKNKAEGAAFLAGNAGKEGVVTLPSGLQYKIMVEGTGKSPQKSDKVTVNYRGTLIDGTEFDSSHKRGTPATFGVDKVIKGWSEALQLMKEGAKWMLYIPSDLAYGERGMQRMIGPNQTLIFEVELINVQSVQ